MRFNRAVLSLVAVAGLALLAACGKLSDKDSPSKVIYPGTDTGCFDLLGDKVTRYFDGNIDEAEWMTTFDCVKEQVTFFRKFVRGAVPGGYVQADIASLVRRFLIVKRPISDQFIASIFDLKASAFGGKNDVITTDDIDEFLRLNEVLRRESTKLLPILKAKKQSPTGDNLLSLADGIGSFGDQIAKYLSGLKGSVGVSKDSFIPFAREIITINGGDPSVIDRYGDFIRNVKVIVASGSPDMIEKGAWATLVREGAAFGGLLLAYRDMEDTGFLASEDQDQFMIDLAQRTQVVVNRVISLHGTGIPLESFNPVIDTLPWSELTPSKRAAIKKDLSQIVLRALQAKIPGWLTTKAVGNLFDLYSEGMRSQMHVKRIYKDLPAAPSLKDFETAARKYRESFRDGDQRNEVDALIEISKTFIGLFPEGSSRMLFTKDTRESRTRNHMIRMSWYRHAIQYLLSVYASGPATSPGHKAAKVEDLGNLIFDFNDILVEWKLSDPSQTVAQMAAKRFREANLFTPISNGDKVMDEVETTYYLAFLMSSSSLSGSIYNTIMNDWKACPVYGHDDLGQDAMPADCFRKWYFDHSDVFWAEFPDLQRAYEKMSDSEKASLKYSMEVASRKDGYSQKPIGPYDIDSFSALPHYVEDIMERFDADDNEKLDRTEILDRAFPIFKQTLAAYSSSTGIQKAILTYIIHYGKAPSSTPALLLWWARMKFVTIEATRGNLYQVVAVLSSPPKPLDSQSDDQTQAAWAALNGLELH